MLGVLTGSSKTAVATFTVRHGPHILLVVGRTSRKEVARFKARKPEGPRKIV